MTAKFVVVADGPKDLFLGIVLGGLIIMFILNPHKYIILLSEKDKDIESLKNEAEKLYKLNKELVDGVQKINQQSISNIQYYDDYIRKMMIYYKEKYNDVYVEGQNNTKEPKNYNIDNLLDKISNFGFESLSNDEKNFLKNIK